MVRTSESVDEILKCDYSNKSHHAVHVHYAVKGGCNF